MTAAFDPTVNPDHQVTTQNGVPLAVVRVLTDRPGVVVMMPAGKVFRTGILLDLENAAMLGKALVDLAFQGDQT